MRALTVLALVALPILPAKYIHDRLAFFGAFRHTFDSVAHLQATGDYFAFPEIIHAEDLAYHAPSGQIVALGQTEARTRSGWFPAWANLDRPYDGFDARGALWVIDSVTWKSTRIELIGFDQQAFVTHGIDIFPFPDDPSRFHLHAINHSPIVTNGHPQPVADSRIEHFIVDLPSRSAKHVKTIRHPLMYTPNDIYSLGPDELLATNDHHYRNSTWRLILEDFLTLPITSFTRIVHLDAADKTTGSGPIGTVVADRLHNANGLGHGPRGEIIQADVSGGRMNTYSWVSGKLTQTSHWPLDLAIDNPTYYEDPYRTPTSDASGYVIAGLLSGIHLDQRARDPEANIPSSLYIVRQGTGGIEKKLLLEDDGKLVSSAATALLIPIKPENGDNKREAWAVIDGPWARFVAVVKVDLTDWARKV